MRRTKFRALGGDRVYKRAIGAGKTEISVKVRLHSMTPPRDNRALASLCGVLNELDVYYPDTELRLVLEATHAATA